MAAPAPASSNQSWDSNNPESHESIMNTDSLEVGMSGMSLLSIPDGHSRKETSSTVASSPPDEEGSARRRVLPPGSDYSSWKGSAPPSPSSQHGQSSSIKSAGRPPGLSGPLPSPIGKHVANSKNTSATSPSLTLTPNSSVDGNSDWNSIGRQSSPFQGCDPPSLPFLSNPEHRRGMDGSFGSGELSAGGGGGHDGLLGLGALRERSYSSPGGFSTSPPVSRGMISAHMLSDQQGDRLASRRERPPLSHPSEGPFSNHQGGNFGGFNIPSSSASSRSDPNNTSMDSADSRMFGAIGRHELRQSSTEYDSLRVRPSSSEFQNSYGGYPPEQHVSHKFGSLPTLGSHLQQQRGPDSTFLPKPRHVRSVSQPGFSAAPQMPPQMDSRYYGGSVGSSRHSFTASNALYKEGGSVGSSSRSLTHQQVFSNAVQYGKAGSTPNLAEFIPSLQRRDPLEYHISPGGQSSGSYAMSADDIRSLPAPSMISPGHSPLQIHYGGGGGGGGGGGNHSRHPSDSGGGLLSSSPLSMGSGAMHGSSNNSFRSRHTAGSSDDDLAHPLVGEHIEVPDHDDHGLPNFMGGGLSGHGHSLSMGEVPAHYMDHLPTAGSALPAPKVVYSVKFKRTQRNFVLGPRINRDLKIGTYVKVEADRGEDLGIVVGKMSADKYGFSRSSFTAGMGPPPGSMGNPADLKRIIRLATHDEVSLLSMKREEEEELLKICRGKVRQRGLPMHVVDAEYQFDRHKLTFFFEAEGRVDFRELVRDLFSMYKTRIWMQQLDKNTSTSSPAIIAPQTSHLQMDVGTPIIAPVSEFADSVVLNGLPGGDQFY